MAYKPKIIKPTTTDIIAFQDGSMRLDTGMTAKEAVAQASAWWARIGRKEMRQHAKRQSEAVGGSNNGAGASFASLDPDSPNFLPSGIIHGLPWEQLSRREKARVTAIWHHFHVRVPDMLGGENQDFEFKPNRLKID